MKSILSAVVLLASVGTAMACAPAPDCWIAAEPGYLRSICKGYAKKGLTVQEIAEFLEQPEKICMLVAACRHVGVKFKTESK